MLCCAPISAHDLQERRGGVTLCSVSSPITLVLPQPACCHGTHPSEQLLVAFQGRKGKLLACNIGPMPGPVVCAHRSSVGHRSCLFHTL